MPRPIVLAHGIARFDVIFAALGHHVYFKRIPGHLRELGFDVHRSSVDFSGSVDTRSHELEAEVEAILGVTGADKVHIIAHSMGGLDARHMIVDLGMADRVVSLTTIGTPHTGTSFADVGLEHGDRLIDLLRPLGIRIDGFRDLARAPCAEFNRRAEAAEATNPVRYRVYSSHQAEERVLVLLRPSWRIIRDRQGEDNDGLVPVSSQEWQPVLRADGVTKAVERHRFPVGADHFNQTGSWDPAEASSLLGLIAEKRDYESTIREIYAGIARDVTAGDP